MPLSPNEIKERAVAFAHEWAGEDSERAEAQSFWNGFFNVFGIDRKRVGVFEKQVKMTRAGEKLRHGRIDLFWKGTLLVEHKSGGADLDRAFAQAADYFDGLRWLAHQTDRRNLVLFLGSNIGNFDKPRARAFLRRLWNALNPADRVLIGFDLKKDIEALLLAYNDPQGVTERFNLNLLERINRELGGTFNPDKFRFFSTYNVFSGALESYLVSLVDQRVYIEALSQDFHFAPWEPIHTEYSYKYLDHDITDLAQFTRFAVEARWYDAQGWFCDALWRVEKG